MIYSPLLLLLLHSCHAGFMVGRLREVFDTLKVVPNDKKVKFEYILSIDLNFKGKG